MEIFILVYESHSNLYLFSDIGDLSPFSYFSQPISFVGNQVQYEVSADEQVKTVSANSPPISATPPDTPSDTPPENTSAERLILTPEDIPEELRASDDIFYSNNDDSIESEFYYVTDDEESVTTSEEVYDTSNNLSDQPVSYYYKDLPDSYSNHGESVSNSYLSYPSYPPLAPAPPAPPAPSQDSPPPYGFRVKSEPQSTERIYASQDPYLNEVSTPSKPQSKRENQQGPIISYKSAYSSQDLDKSYKSAYTSQDISAVPSNPSQPQINEPQTLLAPDGSVFYLEGVSEEKPQQESHEVFKNPPTPSPIYYKYPSSTPDYSRQETLIEAPSAPKVPPTKVPQPVVYYREVQSTTSAPAPAPLPLQDNPDAFSGEPSYEDESGLTGSGSGSEAIETKANLVSFDIPPSMTFEIPQEFRTFLNTPPKWINLENW